MPRTPVLALAAVFFASGAAALLFETLWFRQVGLVLGNSVWASSLVLSAFMAGLALGNGLVARCGARIRRPVRFYALAEIAIALSGLALVLWLPALSRALAPLLRPIAEQPWLVNPLRLGLAFGLLLIPATAMGATLPVLVAALRRHDPNFGSALGRLYGWNTLGAVAGALVGEFWLLAPLGVPGTAAAAAALNLLAAAGALALARALASEAAGPAPPAPRWVPLSSSARRLLAATFGAGFALLALEVVWFRFLALFLVPTPGTFAVLLAAVLAGIGVGGLLGGAWLRADPGAYRHAAVVAFAAGALSVASYVGFARVMPPAGADLAQGFLVSAYLALPLMFPVALLSGVLFTLTATGLNAELGLDIESAGIATLANTVGSGLGSFAAGFLLLPGLGSEISLFALAAAYGVVGALLLAIGAPDRFGHPLPRLAAAAALALALLLFPFGRLRDVYVESAARRFGYPERMQIVGAREGRSESVLYLRDSLDGEPVSHMLVTNGFGMASNDASNRRYMKLFVYWPLAMSPGTRSALLISYGVGSTAKALVDSQQLERIDVVDISRDVLEMSELVYPGAEWPLADPRVHVHIEDGRHFLQLTERRFDLITAEPPPPRHAGVASLYSQEYFQLIRDRLSEGGIATYWLPVHHLTPSTSAAIIRAFCSVFADCSLWAGTARDWMLAGSRGGYPPPSPEAFSRQWRDPRVAPELRAVGIEEPEQLGALFLADAAQLEQLTGRAQPLVDAFPKRIEDRAPGFEEVGQAYVRWGRPGAARRRLLDSEWLRSVWPEALYEASLASFAFQGQLYWLQLQMLGSFANALESLHVALTQTRLETLPLLLLGESPDRVAAAQRLVARGAPPERYRLILGASALATRDYARAAEAFAALHAASPESAQLAALHVYSLILAERRDEAQRIASQAAGLLASLPGVAGWLGTAFGIALDGAEAHEGTLERS